jgi:hypothetical protein
MPSPFAGRWDLTQGEESDSFPSWLELIETAEGWTGRYVGIWGSARPVPNIAIDGENLEFSLPNQYEGYTVPMVFKGQLAGDSLVGTTNAQDGSVRPWKGVRAPDMVRSGEPVEEGTINLIGSGLEGWKVRWPATDNNWVEEGGALVNKATGTDILTEALFDDFKLVAEYSYPTGSNSGIYLRGRYEFQVLDDYGQEPSLGSSGAIYGFFVPLVNAVKPFGEVNRVEITLRGRRLTAVLNGQLIHDDVEIPGITGGAADSDEGAPGPILLQGDHGPVTFHKVELTRLG